MRTIDEIRSRPVYFSELKRMALSPAHVLAALQEPGTDTPAMRLGRTVHALVLGGQFIVYDGERTGNKWRAFQALASGEAVTIYPGARTGKAWKEFREAHDGETIFTADEHDAAIEALGTQTTGPGIDIVSASELETARRAADSVLAHPRAVELLAGRHEVPLEWRVGDRLCATRGVDVIGERWVTELKTSATTAPWRFPGLAIRMHYHVQIAWYAEALRQHRHVVDCGYIVGVETFAPFAVTTFEISTRAMVEGGKLWRLWLERLLVCEASDEWPAYSQCDVPIDLPEDEAELTFGEEGEAA